MADVKEETVQVNAGEMPAELVEKLDKMCEADENSRSAFIRKLIRQEWARRQQMALPLDVVTTSTQRGKKIQKATAVAVA